MKTLRLITDATAEPVSIADLKTFIGLSTVETKEDSLLLALQKGARKHVENYTKRALLPETWRQTHPEFGNFNLMRAPVLASTDVVITYLDPTTGDSTTLSSTVYGVDTEAEPPRVYLKDGQDWPEHWESPNAVVITFVAGYTASASTDTCPEAIETWIKMRVKQGYEFREPMQAAGMGNILPLPHAFVDGLLDPYVLIDVTP